MITRIFSLTLASVFVTLFFASVLVFAQTLPEGRIESGGGNNIGDACNVDDLWNYGLVQGYSCLTEAYCTGNNGKLRSAAVNARVCELGGCNTDSDADGYVYCPRSIKATVIPPEDAFPALGVDCNDGNPKSWEDSYHKRVEDILAVSVDFAKDYVDSIAPRTITIEERWDSNSQRWIYDPYDMVLPGRNFTPRAPYSPFDDTEIKVYFDPSNPDSEACPGTVWDVRDELDDMSFPTLSFMDGDTPFYTFQIENGDRPKTRSVLPTDPVYPGLGAKKSKESDENALIYSVILRGSKGWISDDEQAMERLISVIDRDGRVKMRFEQNGATKDFTLDATTLHWYWGDRNNANVIVGMRGESSGMTASDLLGTIDGFRSQAVNKIQPFEKYQDKFSYVIDLANHDDTEFIRILNDPTSRIVLSLKGNSRYLFPDLDAMSSYKFTSIKFLFSNFYKPNDIGWPPYAISGGLGWGIFIDSKDNNEVLPLIMAHEYAHSFAGLFDEYVQKNRETIESRKLPSFLLNPTNCSIDRLKDFSYQDISYDFGKPWGCSVLKVEITDVLGQKEFHDVLRSSVESIMGLPGGGDRSKFNTVSCGYVLKNLLRQNSAHSYFPVCEAEFGNQLAI
ncbi:MAG: hypothetical protein A3G52_01795 [Candidatus Taylorbacteria bacterium RIFCSPLOWO2_12_FULL_43_20]|uniref:Uncharacterized protein n=1 Tax=Candidatus Taylorbacteria bacterium RIFCSPLOWO2_12_FULL_43_20 TaxID=1802332 RepID=A0A1G2P0X7_9BACT|nr:MAG: hypothetical protein A3B98_00280 [Candidatus Taylorbacteria bacterium RIFCSPHIGHO2_02_FULL_43_55]OHA29935.1 MAG: hypothetical protein A3E92_03910 [Candidatus Taylorbacteria bacterium RIFCSPHIGHO2_12_FULL_42_34]OHA30567.1 MAG: hypothetical protein A3B09_01530 [Candidatus Taylorbacteria bacterium RIFCSPLOWO2_01_FULL_43_83]OHA38399.1 MAG: hypothetical protein A3H58_04335 [Candidatus Taylorbacteria bacterium RIFCSPLOWO2_02_FULL_43_22b]OHA42007.1 MAG: hypothetical protein A3G52_01795 [Candid